MVVDVSYIIRSFNHDEVVVHPSIHQSKRETIFSIKVIVCNFLGSSDFVGYMDQSEKLERTEKFSIPAVLYLFSLLKVGDEFLYLWLQQMWKLRSRLFQTRTDHRREIEK